MPTSMARPPKVVTISAVSAARRFAAEGRVVAHQQVGEDGGQLPEDVEPDQVVGGDQAQHRAGEGDQHRAGPGGRVVVAEVPAAVEQHQGADRR